MNIIQLHIYIQSASKLNRSAKKSAKIIMSHHICMYFLALNVLLFIDVLFFLCEVCYSC